MIAQHVRKGGAWPQSFLKGKRGFTLVELSIVVVLAALVATGGLYALAQEMRYQAARAQVDQLKVWSLAVEKYTNKYSKELLEGTDIAGVASDWEPTVAELKTLLLLDGTFSGATLYSPGGTYASKIRKSPAGCAGLTCGFFSLAYLTTPIVDSNGRVDNPSLGEALVYGGGNLAASGDLDKANVRAAKGMWAEPSPLPAVSGILAIRSSGAEAFVRADGSTTMTGALKMGSNDITNVNNFIASGTVTGGDIKATNNVSAVNVTATNLISGATLKATNNVTSTNVQATNNISAATVTATTTVSAGTSVTTNTANSTTLNTTTANVGGTLNTASGQTIANNGRLHVNAAENLYVQPWSGGSTNIGGGGGSGQLNVHGSEYVAGNSNVNDVYVRAVGKWASQLNSSGGGWDYYPCMVFGPPGAPFMITGSYARNLDWWCSTGRCYIPANGRYILSCGGGGSPSDIYVMTPDTGGVYVAAGMYHP